MESISYENRLKCLDSSSKNKVSNNDNSQNAISNFNSSLPQSPIDPSRIINKELIRLERFLCSICHNLLIDMKKCNLCSAHFCLECIIKYKRGEHASCVSFNDSTRANSEYCPSCNTIDFKIEEGESYLKKFILELNIKCKYLQCEDILFYSNIGDHEQICKFREKTCENCQRVLDYSNYYHHIVDCYKLSENVENSVRQKRVLGLIKAFDDKMTKIKYDNKFGINVLKLEMQKSMSKLDEKIRTMEKYVSEQDYIIRAAGLEKFKLNSPMSVYSRNFKECQVYYYCRGGYNGCIRTGNVWGSNPYTSDSVICLSALHSGHITKEGGLFIVKKGGPLDAYVGSVKNGVSTQSYGSFDHMLVLPSELDLKLTLTSHQCGPRIGICKGKANNCIEKGDVWGDNPYVRESNLCKAALHSGLITENGGIFMVEEAGTHGGYIGTNKNSITSLPCSSNRVSIIIKPFLPY